MIGDHWASVLWGSAFEDLATRTVEPGGRNLADDYLKRRGWNEAGPTKLYIRALRTSVMSLYEVSDIEPGTGFLARDLIRGGDPVRISERSASQTLRAWDRIGARVVTVGGKQLLSGGVLSFTTEAADALLAGLRDAESKRGRRFRAQGLPETISIKAARPNMIHSVIFHLKFQGLNETQRGAYFHRY